jgi:Zn-dependent M28 family amino/carboxypeptidase
MRDIRHLANEIGPRHGTSRAFEEAADWVERRFVDLGYQVDRQQVTVPAGTTWGVRVPRGQADNIIASPPGFDDESAHRIVGAHLDTVPRSPGAEDNASGIAVLLELARIHADDPEGLRFIAFAAEEPRGLGDAHHYGSRAYVRRLDDAERDAVRGMISMDRVGVGRAVPLSTGGLGTRGLRNRLEAIASARDVRIELHGDDRASDHWSFERAGLRAVRVGSVPYCCYHAPTDRPHIISKRQLRRVGVIVGAWLRGGG